LENGFINILENFNIAGKAQSLEADRTGLINDTYIASYDYDGKSSRYVLQRINTGVFKKPLEVMANIELVLDHIMNKVLLDTNHPDPDRGVLKLVRERNGKTFYLDQAENYWRVYRFIEDAAGFNTVTTDALAYSSDLDISKVHVTIPDFHNIVKRYEALALSIGNDVKNRKRLCEKEISFALDRKDICNTITRLVDLNQIPVRVTHNDTKINNVLMDRKTMKGLCVIDLDTVMPGTALSDFGDMVRTFTPPVNEDEPDITKVSLRMNIFQAMVSGYLSEANQFLTPAEKSHLVYGGKLITLMQGIRNLTDFLNGDVYYKVEYEDQNLIRSRNQFALVDSIEKREKEMQEFIDAFVN
jgi:thiamine kinase-like enzyme